MGELSALVGGLVRRFNIAETGAAETPIPGVRLFYREESVSIEPLLYESGGVVLMVAGRKLCHLDGRVYCYDQDNYLTIGLPLPMSCETIASPDEPMFAIFVEAEPQLVRDVAFAMGITAQTTEITTPAVAAAPLSAEMSDALQRLLRCLASDTEAAILGEGLAREIIFRALQGAAAGVLRGLLNNDGQTSRIARVVHAMQADCARRHSVEDLARMAGMSVSAFHRAFRHVTGDTPLQYLKKVRLSVASNLLIAKNYKVCAAAIAVGYESAAQFSRDFKGYFGVNAVNARQMGYAFAHGTAARGVDSQIC